MANSPQPLWTVVGKKIVMAVTGLLLCLFLVGHLAGNYLLLMGTGKTSPFNSYANFLDALPILPLVEIGLLLIFLMHAYDGVVLTLGNKKARPDGYASKEWARKKSDKSRKSVSSSTMMWTGTVILVFVTLHVWHFKYNHPLGEPPVPRDTASVAVGVGTPGVATSNPAASPDAANDLANLVVSEFQKPIVVGFYVFCMVVLGIHLFHAVSSSFQSLGASNPKFAKPIVWLGKAFTIVIAGGFAFLPLWIKLFAHLPGGRP